MTILLSICLSQLFIDLSAIAIISCAIFHFPFAILFTIIENSFAILFVIIENSFAILFVIIENSFAILFTIIENSFTTFRYLVVICK
jgi:hypothetical protein